MESGLLRQRRNIVGISSILIVYDFAEIKINQVGWMGSSIEVGNPVALSIIIWVVWSYFLIRYYQYWSSEKDANVWVDLKNRTSSKAIYYCERRYPIGDDPEWDDGVSLKRIKLFKWHVTLSDYHIRIAKVEAPSYKVPILLLMWWSLVVFFSYCLGKKHMSEHVLPFVLAVAAFFIKMYSFF